MRTLFSHTEDFPQSGGLPIDTEYPLQANHTPPIQHMPDTICRPRLIYGANEGREAFRGEACIEGGDRGQVEEQIKEERMEERRRIKRSAYIIFLY